MKQNKSDETLRIIDVEDNESNQLSRKQKSREVTLSEQESEGIWNLLLWNKQPISSRFVFHA